MQKKNKKSLNRVLRQKRNRAKLFGTADRPRLSVFRSNKFTYVQLIDDSKGRTLAAASTKGEKGKKTASAKNLGVAIAEKAKKLGVKSAIFNKSFYSYHGRIKAVAEAAREAGLKI